MTAKQQAISLPILEGYIPTLELQNYYLDMFADPDFIACYGYIVPPSAIIKALQTDIVEWQEFGFGATAWFDRRNNAFIGRAGINHNTVEDITEIEITYQLMPEYWGQGIAVEISRWALNFGFNTLGLEQIVCFTTPSNTQSLRVIEKLGFSYERMITHYGLPHKLFRMYRDTEPKQHKVSHAQRTNSPCAPY